MSDSFQSPKRSLTGRTGRRFAFGLAAAVIGLGWSVSAAAKDNPDREEICEPCLVTAALTLQSELAEARGEYFRLAAQASTLPDAGERLAAHKEARATYREDLALARERHEARLTVCGDLGECRYHPDIRPEDFLSPAETAANPNPYWPMVPGTTFTYRNQGGESSELNEVTITRETKQILGVTCVVVRDRVFKDGELAEDTEDWYAQDKKGDVWYFGELTLEYEDGELAGIEGSWEAGKDGGKPGVIMRAEPKVGESYRQEFSPGVVEDAATVLSLQESVTIPYGAFDHCLKTGEFTPIEPESVEVPHEKYYAAGVGFVLEVNPDTGERLELIAIEKE